MRIISIFFLIAIIFSCQDTLDRPAKPDQLIEEDKMKELLQDMALLEAHIQLKHIHINKFHELLLNSGDSLISSKGFTRKQFEESMEYYAADQEKMIKMYNEIIASLMEVKE